MPSATYAITGGTGFVGSQLLKELLEAGHLVIHIGRQNSLVNHPNLKWVQADLGSAFNVTEELRGVSAVFHLAARAHVMRETAKNSEELYRQMNTEATRMLAEQAANAKVKHFVFLSSVKAVGEESSRFAWRENTQPAPPDIYGVTKLEAEKSLKEICGSSSMTFTILRSPLVYGPGVRANFLSLIKAVDNGIPLPFGRTKNRRSIVARKNLTSALRMCADNPNAKNKTYFVSDPHPLSTAQLIKAVARALGKRPLLIPFPVFLLKALGVVTFKSAQVNRLTNNLELDISAIQRELGWKHPQSTADALRETAAWYRSLQNEGQTDQRQISNK